MSQSADEIVVLTSAPTEMEAGIIAAALEESGIRTKLTGQTVSGFRAEAPGWVQVLVAERDLPSAQAVLDDIRQHQEDIDWSGIDFGEPDEPEEAPLAEAPRLWTSLSLWRQVAQVIVIIGIVWFLARLGADLIGALLQGIGFRP